MKLSIKYILPLLASFCIVSLFGDSSGISELRNSSYYYTGIGSSLSGANARQVLINVFFALAGMLFIVAVIVAFLAAIRLLASDNSEEDFSKWSRTLVWSIAGLFLVAISFGVLTTLKSNVLNSTAGFSISTIYNATVKIIYPLLSFLRYIAAICFFIVLIFAFYKIIIAGGDEEGFQSGKKTFIAAAIGFIIMVLAEPIVRMVYGGANCGGGSKVFGISTECSKRVFSTDTFFDVVIKIIIFLNGFIAIITVLMIMYAGFLVLTGGGDEEKTEKAKKTIIYAIIGVLIILFSFAIYKALLFNATT